METHNTTQTTTTEANTEANKSNRAPLADLNQFTGTEAYHRLTMLWPLKCTDGVKYVADEAGAYWLVDIVASYQPQLQDQEFQQWILTVNPDHSATVICTDGNEKELIRQKLEYTDFPLPSITFYCIDNVLLLTSEY